MKDCLGGGVRGICTGQEIGNEEVIWLVAILRIEPGPIVAHVGHESRGHKG